MAEEIIPEFGPKALTLPNGKQLGFLPKDYKIFLDSSTILYGLTKTGKSTIILEIVNLLREHIPWAIAFAPTNDSNNTYTGVLPASAIKKQLTRRKIEKIVEKQAEKARLYAMAHNVTYLEQIFHELQRIGKARGVYFRYLRIIDQIKGVADNYIEQVKASSAPESDKDNYINKIRKNCEKSIVDNYRNAIRQFQTELRKTMRENYLTVIVQYLDINPRILLILDDCLEDIKQISKVKRTGKSDADNASIMDKIFFKGRHYFITILIASQNDADITVALRRNTFLSIFADAQSATHYFNNGSNSFTKDQKSKAQQIIGQIFDGSKSHHRKLVYSRLGGDDSSFMYTIANLYGRFRFGSDAYWDYCSKAEAELQDDDKSFLQSLMR